MNIFKTKEYLRSIMFGIEDSLVSTTGILAGISIGSDEKKIIILGGVVAITIEAVSMGIGEYLSDEGVEELEKLKRHKDNPILSGLLMFASYFIAGVIPLAPFILLNSISLALTVSVISALISLFLLGFVKGKIVKVSPLRSGLKILLLGGLATILGLIVGIVFKI